MSNRGLLLGPAINRFVVSPVPSRDVASRDASGTPCITIKVMQMGLSRRRRHRRRNRIDPFLVLKLGDNVTIMPSMNSPSLHPFTARPPLTGAEGPAPPRLLEIFLYGGKRSRVHLQGIARFPIDRIVELGNALCRVNVALEGLLGEQFGHVLFALRSDRLDGDLAASSAERGVAKPCAPLRASEPQYVVVSAGGETSIGVLQKDTYVD